MLAVHVNPQSPYMFALWRSAEGNTRHGLGAGHAADVRLVSEWLALGRQMQQTAVSDWLLVTSTG